MSTPAQLPKPLNYAFPTFIPGKFRIPPDFKLWPEAFYPDLKGANLPQTPPIPPQVSTGDVIMAGHENTVSNAINDLWVNEQWLAAHSIIDPTTAVGDLVVHGPSGITAQPIGANGQMLMVDTTQPNKMKWATITPASIGAVSSVFGRGGAVVSASGDYTAAQVTNAVDSSQTYANPAWITSLAWGKITGAPPIATISGNANYIPLFTGPNTLINSVIYQSGSNIGIGTTTPATNLDLGGILNFRYSAVNNCYVGNNVTFVPGTGFQYIGTGYASTLYFDVDGSTEFRNAPSGTAGTLCTLTERMRITNAGNVGIGTTSPTALLHLSKGAPASTVTQYLGLQNLSATDGAILRIAGLGYSGGNIQTAIDFIQNSASNWQSQMAFSVQNGVALIEAMRINPAGNVGIGTTSPIGVVDIAAVPSGGGINNWVYINCNASGNKPSASRTSGLSISWNMSGGQGESCIYYGTGAGTQPMLSIGRWNGTATNNDMNLYNGNIGLAILPSYQLHLSTDSAAKPTTSTWTVASDARLKRNIRDLTGGLDVIRQLHLIEAEYNGLGGMPEGGRVVGFLADELREIVPHAVGSTRRKLAPADTEETDILDMNMHEVLLHLILAVQQLNQRITEKN